MERTERCPDCAVSIAQQHATGCDVARCLETGHQRLSCPAEHDCGRDEWFGYWPGSVECERYHVDLNVLTGSGRFEWHRMAKNWVPKVALPL